MTITAGITALSALVALAVWKTSRTRSAARMIAHLNETEGDG